MKILKLLLKIALVLVLLVVLVLGYYGFVPGVSALFGSNKARDLGMKTSAETLASFEKKSGVSFGTLSSAATPEESISFEGSTSINADFAPEEVASVATQNPWKYFPIQNPQMRFNADGSTELSGVVDTAKVTDYLRAHHLLTPAVQPYLDKLTAVGLSVPVYAKSVSSWKNDQLTLDVQEIEVGRYTIGKSTVDEYHDRAVQAVEALVSSVPHLSIDSLTFSGGVMHAQGTFPEKVSVLPQ